MMFGGSAIDFLKNINIKSVAIFVGLIFGSLMVSYLITNTGPFFGILIIAFLIGLPLLIKSMTSAEFGIYFLLWYSFFLFLIGRLLPIRLPVGLGVEIIASAIGFGLIINDLTNKKTDWSYFNNPVTYIFLLLECYNLLQFFNPNAVSLQAWFMSTRGIVFDLISYFVVVRVFSNLGVVIKFTKLWLFFSLLAALYGFNQEIFGYMDFEWRDIYSNPNTIYLIRNWGILRKFSFLSDVAAFGIQMAISAICCLVLAMGPFHWSKRIILIASALIMLVAMSFSGTRTATAIVPAGLLIYIIMHINSLKTQIMLFVGILTFIVIMFGPFYGTSIMRIRSTFQPKNDASMNVREYNRKRIQPYIHSHPIGGGVYTTDAEGEYYSPGHPLAGFATDSGYLKTALTIGWIGLIIQMAFYFSVIALGVSNFYKAKNLTIKSLYAAYIALLFALLIANYAQSAMGQKPTGLLVFATFALMPNMIKFDQQT